MERKMPAEAPTAASSRDRNLGWAELGLGLALTAALVALHGVVLYSAGPLWRDEVSTVNVSSLPSLGDMWNTMPFDSFPALWFLTLRAWEAIGLGGTDFGLRVLGFIVGLGVVAALWWTARRLGGRVPLFALVLFGLAPTVLRFGDSMRAYGLGVILMLLALGAIWRVVQEPGPRRIALACVAAVLGVHCLYYNAVMLFAICMGGVAVCLRRRAWKTAGMVLGIGAAAAISLLPYWGIIAKVQEWNVVLKVPVSLEWVFLKFSEAVVPAGEAIVWVWVAVSVVTLAACIYRTIRPGAGATTEQKDLPLFVATTLVVGTVAYVLFLKVLGYQTDPWYYMSIMALVAVLTDAAVQGAVGTVTVGRFLRLGAVVVIAALVAGSAWTQAHFRQTNVDLIAARLQTAAGPDDLVLLKPWWMGLTFQRYYHGPTTWMTLPDIPNHQVHQMDQIKGKMMERDPIRPVLERIMKTLQSGHRVWLVGEALFFLPPGQQPGYVPPAPNERFGWWEGPYNITWWQQAAYFIQQHGVKGNEVAVPVEGPVNGFENLQVICIEGWH